MRSEVAGDPDYDQDSVQTLPAPVQPKDDPDYARGDPEPADRRELHRQSQRRSRQPARNTREAPISQQGGGKRGGAAAANSAEVAARCGGKFLAALTRTPSLATFLAALPLGREFRNLCFEAVLLAPREAQAGDLFGKVWRGYRCVPCSHRLSRRAPF